MPNCCSLSILFIRTSFKYSTHSKNCMSRIFGGSVLTFSLKLVITFAFVLLHLEVVDTLFAPSFLGNISEAILVGSLKGNTPSNKNEDVLGMTLNLI